MATKRQSQAATVVDEQTQEQQEQTTVEEQPEQTPTFDLEYLKAQQKLISEQIKQAKAALPTMTPLEKVIARQQTAELNKWIIRQTISRIHARVKAGQSVDEALDQILAHYRVITLEALERANAAE